MRKIASIVLLSFSVILYSQEKFPRTELSVVINPLVSWMQSDVREVKVAAPRIGIDGGLCIDHFFAERYAFNTGISIGTYGGTLKYNNSTDFTSKGNTISVSGGSEVTYKLQYITIPLGLKLKTKRIGYLTYYAQMGLYTQFNIKATAESDDNSLQGDDVSDNVKGINMGYQFGLGSEYDLGNGMAFVMGLGYSNGVIDVTSHKNDKIILSNLSVKLGILF